MQYFLLLMLFQITLQHNAPILKHPRRIPPFFNPFQKTNGKTTTESMTNKKNNQEENDGINSVQNNTQNLFHETGGQNSTKIRNSRRIGNYRSFFKDFFIINDCTTPYGLAGNCVKLQDCQSLRTLIFYIHQPGTWKILNSHQCRLSSNDLYYCCADNRFHRPTFGFTWQNSNINKIIHQPRDKEKSFVYPNKNPKYYHDSGYNDFGYNNKYPNHYENEIIPYRPNPYFPPPSYPPSTKMPTVQTTTSTTTTSAPSTTTTNIPITTSTTTTSSTTTSIPTTPNTSTAPNTDKRTPISLPDMTCGLPLVSRIREGSPIEEPGSVPWLAAIGEIFDNGTFNLMCGGSLITQRHVITAAHCFYEGSPTVVRLGDYNLESEDDGVTAIDLPITRRLENNFNIDTYQNDITIIILPIDLTFNIFMLPICLPLNFKDEMFENKTLEAFGWGATDINALDDPSPIPNMSRLPVVDLPECQKIFSTVSSAEIDNTQLCAGVGGMDTCQGDSGGPLTYFDPEEFRFVLAGVISYGPEVCGIVEFPSVYTRVGAFLDWILFSITVT